MIEINKNNALRMNSNCNQIEQVSIKQYYLRYNLAENIKSEDRVQKHWYLMSQNLC